MYPRVSPTLSIFVATAFFSLSFSPPRLLSAHGCIFLPLLPLALIVPVQPNQAHSTIRVSRLSLFPLFLLSLSLFQRYVSLFLRSTRFDTIGYVRSLSHTISYVSRPSLQPPFPTPCPYLRPWPSCVHACRLSPSIASVHTRALPLFVASSDEHGYRVCARETRREAGRVGGRKGGRRETERKRRGRRREREMRKSENEDGGERKRGKMRVEEERGLRSPGAPWAFLVFY